MAVVAPAASSERGGHQPPEGAHGAEHHHHHHHHHPHHHHHHHHHRRRDHMRTLSVSSSNALEHFPRLEGALKSKRVVVLLDYDGTLTPIVNDPAQALLPSRTRDILVELAERCVVGIVSGRSLPKVQGFVQVPSLFYAGSHGFDIWGPTTESMRYQVAADQLPKLATLRDRLTERLATIQGAAVEDNVFSVSVHYRNCDPRDVQQVYEVVQTIKTDFPSIRFGTGKCVFELRPDITWDKGRAMVWLLQALGLREQEDVFTIYIGDDMTDEDAFQVFCEEAGSTEGVGIVVTDENKVTGANYSLRNPDEVAAFLSRLVESRGHHVGTGGNHQYFTAKHVHLDSSVPVAAPAGEPGASAAAAAGGGAAAAAEDATSIPITRRGGGGKKGGKEEEEEEEGAPATPPPGKDAAVAGAGTAPSAK